MNCPDCSELLSLELDGLLSAAEEAGLQAHLATCEACRTDRASLHALRAQAKALPKELVPALDLWPGLVPQLGKPSSGIDPTQNPGTLAEPILFPSTASLSRSNQKRRISRLAFMAAAGLVLGFALYGIWSRETNRLGWEVAPTAGVPRIGTRSLASTSRLAIGQWLETDQASRAKLAVGLIGEVNLEPNSRLRLVQASTSDHRVELTRGTLHALIWAPPRLFFVETPSVTAIDLGCAYTLTVDDQGGGLLTVDSGYVALEHGGREAIVPAGAQCVTRRGAGPGTPFVTSASAELRQALVQFDFERGGPTALSAVLSFAQSTDAITLWHLLGRAPANERAAVYDGLARLHAPPENTTRSGILAGDVQMMARWAEGLGLPAPSAPPR